ncbi:DUF2975 domain-containing protein [Dokdonia ponticola]|uniref:DUF2975 domain-containing protein n=1 Tax=Dokdonia ponticola TaxID=2041041 RepID=A0ABV9I070_9FLAO
MKSLSFLKTLINIYYYLMLLAFAIGLITAPILLFTQKKYDISFLGTTINLTDITLWKSSIALVLIAIIFFLYFRSIHLIKNSVDHISKGAYFTEYIIGNFKKIGKLFIGVGIGATAVKMVITLLLESQIGFSLDSTLFIFIILGLFFLFLSEAFEKASQLKEENELTI